MIFLRFLNLGGLRLVVLITQKLIRRKIKLLLRTGWKIPWPRYTTRESRKIKITWVPDDFPRVKKEPPPSFRNRFSDEKKTRALRYHFFFFPCYKVPLFGQLINTSATKTELSRARKKIKNARYCYWRPDGCKIPWSTYTTTHKIVQTNKESKIIANFRRFWDN